MTHMTPLRHQVCTTTVMDTSDPDIRFDADGVCNYVSEYREFQATLPDVHVREARLRVLLENIRAKGKGKKYDCIIGVSGGVDSSFLACKLHEWGLRPLVFHFDNGWNSELAVRNIEELVTRLDFDLETFVVDWDEFRELQAAYFRASVVDIEVPTDHMIFAALHRAAVRNGIRVLISGHNYDTEWLLPKAWYYSKFDLRNIMDINRRFGRAGIGRLPKLGVWQQFYYHHINGVRTVQPFQYMQFNKAEAKHYLIEHMGWRDYGGKHHESIFTRFYQGYVLPRKFGIDKRKAHLSNLILSGQITRDHAIHELQNPPYDEVLQADDKKYVAKKLGFSEAEFELILGEPPRRHEDFRTDAIDRKLYFGMARTYGWMRRTAGMKKRGEPLK